MCLGYRIDVSVGSVGPTWRNALLKIRCPCRGRHYQLRSITLPAHVCLSRLQRDPKAGLLPYVFGDVYAMNILQDPYCVATWEFSRDV